MFEGILALFRGTVPSETQLPPADVQHALGALLVRAAKADHAYLFEEVEQIDEVLATRYDLDPVAAAKLRASCEKLEEDMPDTTQLAGILHDAIDLGHDDVADPERSEQSPGAQRRAGGDLVERFVLGHAGERRHLDSDPGSDFEGGPVPALTAFDGPAHGTGPRYRPHRHRVLWLTPDRGHHRCGCGRGRRPPLRAGARYARGRRPPAAGSAGGAAATPPAAVAAPPPAARG